MGNKVKKNLRKSLQKEFLAHLYIGYWKEEEKERHKNIGNDWMDYQNESGDDRKLHAV